MIRRLETGKANTLARDIINTTTSFLVKNKAEVETIELKEYEALTTLIAKKIQWKVNRE